MNYKVYTDGAYSIAKSKIASAFVILTDEDFITSKSYVFSGMQSRNAETVAIGSAAECLIDDIGVGKDDTVLFVTDSIDAMSYLNKARELGGLKAYNKVTQAAIETFLTLCNRVKDVQMVHMKSHQDGMNTNKFADRLAKHALSVATASK